MRAKSTYNLEVFDGTSWTQSVSVNSLKSAVKLLPDLHRTAPGKVHRLVETLKIERVVLKGNPFPAPRGKTPAVVYHGKPKNMAYPYRRGAK